MKPKGKERNLNPMNRYFHLARAEVMEILLQAYIWVS